MNASDEFRLIPFPPLRTGELTFLARPRPPPERGRGVGGEGVLEAPASLEEISEIEKLSTSGGVEVLADFSSLGDPRPAQLG